MDTRANAPAEAFNLAELNRLLSTPGAVKWLTVLVFVCALLVMTVPHAASGRWGVPSPSGDGPDYDNIAVQLSKGNGFSVDWDDQDFKSEYESINQSGHYDYLSQRHGSGLTAYRPPLLPLLMAGSFKLFGRGFAPILVMNYLLTALTCAFVFLLVCRDFGLFPGLLFSVRFMVDPGIRLYSNSILTESLSCFLVILFMWCLLHTAEKKTWVWSFLSGLTLSLAFLARSIFIMWLPVILIAIYALARRQFVSQFQSCASAPHFHRIFHALLSSMDG
ncbi:MAG TPA: glycosyltransferase family 39 protein [Deltaproteobacteria bacterium]|nr:glycosyltransferase family 39 protein [Deltaproteobacteria bacterium]HQJ07699.1 glycosyltransferase family 39 protein [Deltaproteobacteria bacterium]